MPTEYPTAPEARQGHRPVCVKVLLVCLLLHGAWAFPFLLFSPVLVRGNLQLSAILAFSSGWSFFLTAAFWHALYDGEPKAWAPLTGALFVKTAFTLALFLAPTVRLQGGNLVAWLLLLGSYPAGLLWLTSSMFKHRQWFGIPEREGWSTLRKRGWWSLLITLAVEIAWLDAMRSLFASFPS